MSENWTFVCATAELLPGEMKTATDETTCAAIVVVNLDGELYALEDRCTHEEFELSMGTFDPHEGSIECLLHGARFDVRSGNALCGPAYTPAARFPVKRENGGVWARDDRG